MTNQAPAAPPDQMTRHPADRHNPHHDSLELNVDSREWPFTKGPTCSLMMVTLLLATGCGGSSTDQAEEGSSVTVLYPGEERILGPYWDMPAQAMMFLPLMEIDEEGDLVGRLATSWDYSSDDRTWTIHLRPDVRWHDGVRFTAHDVKFTFDLRGNRKALMGPPTEVTVIDDTTFTIELLSVLDPLSSWTVFYPKHLLEDLDPSEIASWDFWTHPVGNGPYRYVRHVPKTMMEFEANDDYYEGRPSIDRLVIKFGEQSIVELLSGNVDFGGAVSSTDALRLAEEEQFITYWGAYDNKPWAILWKASLPLFSDPAIRRALTHAIDRKTIQAVSNVPEETHIVDVLSTERQYRRMTLPEPLEYDPDQSSRLLAAAGWADTDGDGMLERDGIEFRFELISRESWVTSAVIIQEQLRRVGVQADIVTLTAPLSRGRARAGDFEAVLEFVPSRWEMEFFGEESVLGYDNSRIQELMGVLEETFDPFLRDSIYLEMMPIFRSEQPVTFVIPEVTYYIGSRSFLGLNNPWKSDPIVNAHYLFLDDESK